MPLTAEERTRADGLILGTAKRGDARRFADEATREIAWQRAFVYDTAPRVALFGERRGAKTTAFGIKQVHRRLLMPNSKGIYIGLTNESAVRVYSNEVLDRIIRTFNVPATILAGGEEIRFENGSLLYVIGLDATRKQKERVRGLKAADVVIDEMQSFTQDVGAIIRDIVGPAAADTQAPMMIGGTAGDAFEHVFWYQVTRENTSETPRGTPSVRHPEWAVWRCKWSENTAKDEITGRRICDNVRAHLEEQKAKHPGIELTDSWRREWNAEWIILASSLVYRFGKVNQLGEPECRELNEAPIASPSEAFLAGATYILGIDLGYNDPTAMVVCAYNTDYSNKLYIIETFQKSGMLVADVDEKLKELERRYEFSYKVGDSSSLQVFESLRQTHGHTIEKADRQGKLSHVHLVNSDLQTRVILVTPGNEELVQQLSTLRWAAKELEKGKYVEDPADDNHLADAFLYAHTFSRSLWYESPKPKRDMTNEERTLKLTKALIEQNHNEMAEDGDYTGDLYGED